MQSLKKIKLVNQEADSCPNVLRLSMDAKDRVKVGNFSRGGNSYANISAYDHDFGNEYITPHGILLPKYDEVKMYFTCSKITANFIVDMLQHFWTANKHRFSNISKLVLNQDNGPECKSTRTQFIKRICEFSGQNNIDVSLAYYPPYHSKYNPVERVWAALEQHWNGSILDEIDTVLKFATNMKWKGQNPDIHFIKNKYRTGIKLNKRTMDIYENLISRDAELGKWFIDIKSEKCKQLVYPKLW